MSRRCWQHELTLIADGAVRARRSSCRASSGAAPLSATLALRRRPTSSATTLGCELIVIDDAGHTAHRMQPKGFADFVRRTVALGREAD